jgi:hypothetical protein
LHKDGKESYKVVLITNADGQMEFSGLPTSFKRLLMSYNNEELKSNPMLVLQTIIKSTEKKPNKPQ